MDKGIGTLRKSNGDNTLLALERRLTAWFLKQLDRLNVWERWPGATSGIQVKMASLYGASQAADQTRRFVGSTCTHILFGWIASSLLALIGGPGLLSLLPLTAVLLPFYRWKQLCSRVRARQVRIIVELPELISKLTLLLQAGETTYQVIHRTATRKEGSTPDPEREPLLTEWVKLSAALRDHKPFVNAMEEFSRSCGVMEASMFATAMLVNYRRGGHDFVHSLQELSHTLWERRKAAAKTLGEEASSKLVFPMLLLFGTVMAVVAAPALLMMK